MTLNNALAEARAIDDLLRHECEAAHQAGVDANYAGILLRDNPYPARSARHGAWEAGHLQAADARREWEESL